MEKKVALSESLLYIIIFTLLGCPFMNTVVTSASPAADFKIQI